MPYMDDDVRARMAELVEEIETSSFRETKWGRRGYSEREVDDFLDYLVDVLFGLLSTPVPATATSNAGAAALVADEPAAGEADAAELDAAAAAAAEAEVDEVVAGEAEVVAAEVEEPDETVLEVDADPGSEGPREDTEVLTGDTAAAQEVMDPEPGGSEAIGGEGGPPLPPWVPPR